MEALAPWAETVLMTADELLELPEDGWCYELVEGRLVRMSPTGGTHGTVVMRLLRAVDGFVEQRGLGVIFPPETGFWISSIGQPDTVLAPDLAFIRHGRESAVMVAGYPRIAPDLVIEVASPSQGRSKLGAKAQRWLRAGVQLVWVVMPGSRTIDVWRDGRLARTFTAEEVLDGEDLLPGFAIPIEKVFA